MIRRFLCLVFSLALATIVAACKGGEGDRDAPSKEASKQGAKVTLKALEFLIDWQAEPTYLGVYYADTIGAYSEAGYKVTVVQSWGANEAATAVAAGKYKVGTASGGATVIANSNQAGLVSLAVLYHRLPTVVFGLRETGIKKPKDLEGKRIGIYPKSITRNEFDAFAKLNGLDLGKIEIVSITGPDLPLILARKVDGVLNYFELSPTLLAVERKTYALSLDQYGVKAYGLNIITSRKTYQSDERLVRDVTQAVLKGYRVGCADQEAAVVDFVKRFPDKDRRYVAESWKKVCDFIGGDYGDQTHKGWEQTIRLYREQGLLRGAVTPEDVLP